MLRVLHVERHECADQQDQPAHVQPDQRHDDDRERRIDRDRACGADDEGREQAAGRNPQNAGRDSAQ